MPPADYPGTPQDKLAAEVIRGQVSDGTLGPGQAVPNAAALSRATGYPKPDCARALQDLVGAGVLVGGLNPASRLRVAGSSSQDPAALARESAGYALSAGLAVRRGAAGLTQLELAGLAGVKLTVVSHAETGRLWQARDFWENADRALGARGEILGLHDAYLRAKAASPGEPARPMSADLSPREQEVAALFARGLDDDAIAGQLGISRHTVRFHMSHMYAKAGTKGSARGARLRLAAWLRRRADEAASAAAAEEGKGQAPEGAPA
jgi:DNA-binding CsgD family transcriptional regulator